MSGYKQLNKNMDHDRRVITSPWGREMHFDELGRILPEDFIFQKYHFAEKVVSLELSIQEEAVTRAILITCTGIFDVFIGVDRGKKLQPQIQFQNTGLQ